MNIVFRVDASLQIGTGHLVRCLTLADILKRRGANTFFLSRQIPDHLRQKVVEKGHAFQLLESPPLTSGSVNIAHAQWLGTSQEADAQDTLTAVAGKSVDWLVVDHYALDACWESMLRPAVNRVMVIDDIADRVHDCDLLLDQNFYQEANLRYVGKVPEHCRLLLGPRYALLREEFQALHQKITPRIGPVGRILVFFGGVDEHNNTEVTLKALTEIGLEGVAIDVVIGVQHPAIKNIEAICLQYRFNCHAQTDRMAELMASADLSIGAGGSAMWERCSLGLPTICISVAENQTQQIADAAGEGWVVAPESDKGLAHIIRLHMLSIIENARLRHFVSSSGISAVDGQGAERVAAVMGCTGVNLRVAAEDDCEAIFNWRNHDAIRAVSKNPSPISWEDHVAWFSSVLRDPDRVLLIAERDSVPVGVLRFDIEHAKAEISIYIVPEGTPAVRGRDLLQSGEIWISQHYPEVRTIRANVMGGNTRSQNLFLAAGYDIDHTTYFKKIHQ
ncbi:MAG TPA: UDP-2,4-diacetamido-2,4,6-trideoxy-beta-L-altropyranose hydrolase [Methylophilaceae bacterium]|nr:UDP-2,4-diacetamido-2,4,6-trideoxy-beta-L-altropyranose hydrolase [Methylophilaceae bacterium]